MNNDNSSSTVLLDSIEYKIKNNTLHEITNYDFKTVCLKERVFLKREKSFSKFLKKVTRIRVTVFFMFA